MSEHTRTGKGGGLDLRRVGLGLHEMDDLRVWPHQQRYAPAPPAYEGRWLTLASQCHVRQAAIDVAGRLWLATWGGVLAIDPSTLTITRHGSEHGLSGNPTRAIAVDREGRVWAAGQASGLSCLVVEGAPWEPQGALRPFTVLALAPAQQGGIYLALRDAGGRSSVAHLSRPGADLAPLPDAGLETRDVRALLSGPGGTLWLGNAWGLACHRPGQGIARVALDGPRRMRVSALSWAAGGGVWAGTGYGLFYVPEEGGEPQQPTGWPREPVTALSACPATGELWALTAERIGRVADGRWQTLENNTQVPLTTVLANPRGPEPAAWVGGEEGLLVVQRGRLAGFLGAHRHEDRMSNAVQCLALERGALWLGAAGGLERYDPQAQAWHPFEKSDRDVLTDVRALLTAAEGQQVWVGTWRQGIEQLETTVYIADHRRPRVPITAAATGPGETLWMASPDAVYTRPPGQAGWRLVPGPRPGARSPGVPLGVIQALCVQPPHPAGDPSLLWVGTSRGLLCYRPSGQEWLSAAEAGIGEGLEQANVQALALDARNRLWVGTDRGLYTRSGAHQALPGPEQDVRALLYAPEGTLWVGTPGGLAACRVSAAGDLSHLERFTAGASGLAADGVTALALRADGDERWLWVGTLSGLSRYQYRVEPN